MAAVIPAATQERLTHGNSEGPQIARVRRSPPDRRNHLSRQRVLRRVQAEFDDLRGLLNALMCDGLLRVGADDRYARSDVLRTSMARDGV